MLHGVKLNGEKVLMAKKSLVFLYFIWSKKFDKIIEIPVSLGRRGRGDMFTRQILLKIQKSIGNGPKLVIFIAC